MRTIPQQPKKPQSNFSTLPPQPPQWKPGDPIPPKGVLEPNAYGALQRHCAGCASRDRLNHSLAAELDRVCAENRVLRGELERAA